MLHGLDKPAVIGGPMGILPGSDYACMGVPAGSGSVGFHAVCRDFDNQIGVGVAERFYRSPIPTWRRGWIKDNCPEIRAVFKHKRIDVLEG
jgi:hypothetical protein